MTDHLYIDVHVLQTVPPSNLNRDDAGSPKQAIFGGVRRARVSSQAWKRATRKAFAETEPLGAQATRTKRIGTMLADRLVERSDIDPDAAVRISEAMLKPLGIKPGKKGSETAYLLFFGRSQLDRIVDSVADRLNELAGLGDKELDDEVGSLPVKKELLTGHPIDVALFGRMVADLPELNVDAATQVAHAISTHPVEIEFDYYTAVDDEKALSDTEDAGAGMIGTVEFNSATLYRYATLGFHQLVENLDGVTDDAVLAVGRFVDGFVRSMPTGHQNSFAHRTLPGLVVVVVRHDQPVNLVSAYEEPIRSRSGYATASAARLADEFARAQERWASEPVLVAASYDPVSTDDVAERLLSAFGPSMAFPELLDQVKGALSGALERSVV
ncbi:type I-E CRISPR-associated protein Cas7/Cse4/CasC [soil metagenome]